jgi:type IV pilus assembly protein PilE
MSDVASEAGFSLVELMVVVAITAIIAVFALPAYRDHVLRSYLPEVNSGLQLTALRLEQYYQDHRSYRNGNVCGVTLPTSQRFNFSCDSAADGQSFLLSATGTAAMEGFTFTIDQQGQTRTTALPEGWGTAPLDCWVSKRGATC